MLIRLIDNLFDWNGLIIIGYYCVAAEEMANRTPTEIDSGNCGFDERRDGEGDGGGGDEGGGYPYPLHPMARLQQYASCEMSYNR